MQDRVTEDNGRLGAENRQADAGEEASDDRAGDELHEPADPEHARDHLQDAGEQGGRDQSSDAVVRDDFEHQEGHGGGGAGDLEPAAAEQGDHDTANHGGDQADFGRNTGGGGDGQREWQGHERDRHRRLGVGQEGSRSEHEGPLAGQVGGLGQWVERLMRCRASRSGCRSHRSGTPRGGTSRPGASSLRVQGKEDFRRREGRGEPACFSRKSNAAWPGPAGGHFQWVALALSSIG